MSPDACILLADVQGAIMLITDDEGQAAVFDSPEHASQEMRGHILANHLLVVPLADLESLPPERAP